MDKFDKNIIEILDKNCKLPLSKISWEVRLSKQSISRRIENLYRAKQLFSYYLIIDYFKLGLSNVVFFISLHKNNKKLLHHKINEIKKINSVGWIADFFGRYDLGISIFYHSSYELNQIVNKIQEIFDNNVKETSIISMVEHNIFSFYKA